MAQSSNKPTESKSSTGERKFTDWTPEEREHFLHAPITITTHGQQRSWGGTSTIEHDTERHKRVYTYGTYDWSDLYNADCEGE